MTCCRKKAGSTAACMSSHPLTPKTKPSLTTLLASCKACSSDISPTKNLPILPSALLLMPTSILCHFCTSHNQMLSMSVYHLSACINTSLYLSKLDNSWSKGWMLQDPTLESPRQGLCCCFDAESENLENKSSHAGIAPLINGPFNPLFRFTTY